MAIINGYVDIPHNTFDVWKDLTLGNTFRINGASDSIYYYYISEFWYNIGFGEGYPYTGGGYSTVRIWANRTQNTTLNGVLYFDIITNISAVQRGDFVLYSPTSSSPNGHAGFANNDYNGSNLLILSQDNGSSVVNVNLYSSILFIGAFRYRFWHGIDPPTPPTPTPTSINNFNWALYARKLREKRRRI